MYIEANESIRGTSVKAVSALLSETSLGEWTSVGSLDKKLKAKFKEYREMNEKWGQWRSSTTIFRTVQAWEWGVM